jgi:triose/dihydroxyacetone kinase / FAD-AMP lyase (cyclizing)
MYYTKHLINDPTQSVLENISGFIHANNIHLTSLDDYPNVVLRRDYLNLKTSNKVALLSGGGSGHEPSHVGFIGQGMLTGAVCGELFASPSTDSILAAIRTVASSNGVLLIVKNYTGDRLHFGLAASRARSEGIRVEMVLVNDDVALVNNEQELSVESGCVGRRGLCGTIFVHKLAGSLAEKGKKLVEIKNYIDEILSNNLIRTIGVSLSGGVDLPMKSCASKEAENNVDEIEIGLGIHGEAGRNRIKIPKSYDLVKQLFEHLEFSCKNEPHVDLCLIINNLGGLSNFEFNLLINDCCKYLLTNRPQYKLRRLYNGCLMTSLDMNGFSLTLLIVKDSQLIELLDFSTDAFSWPKNYGKDIHEFSSSRVKSVIQRPNSSTASEIDRFNVLNDEQAILLKNSIENVFNGLIEFKNYLNDLDSKCGDGDCGNSMESFSRLVLSRKHDFNYKDPHEVLSKISSLAEKCGGTMNAILAIGISSAAKAFLKTNEETKVNWIKLWSESIDYAVKAIQEFAGAKPGQRSLLDPLHEINEWLKTNKNEDTNQIVKEIANISYLSAQKTSDMIPKVGRASYVDPSTIKTPDPGAMAINHAFSSIHKVFLERVDSNCNKLIF